jgi:ribosomal protein S7
VRRNAARNESPQLEVTTLDYGGFMWRGPYYLPPDRPREGAIRYDVVRTIFVMSHTLHAWTAQRLADATAHDLLQLDYSVRSRRILSLFYHWFIR